ncbi:glycosyltransferase [Micromonospora zamorensis]|uniref:glycosyltransferase n=1 Tax=Micromonospora zamorensis TaxID=709883 RepID=UPI003D976E0D
MTGPRYAFFDDYPLERGHHPDLAVGLALAASAPLYCPPSFLDGRPEARSLRHTPTIASPDQHLEETRRNLDRSIEDAASLSSDTFVNLFFDENWDSFPVSRRGLRHVQALHRPGELTGTLGGINAIKRADPLAVVNALARTDLFVVHTPVGEQQARAWLPADRVLRAGWPTATEAEIRRRIVLGRHRGENPYVLLVGEALDYKGIDVLVEAVDPGPLLRIAGNLTYPGPDWLAAQHPGARVQWEPGWVARDRMSELVAGASVVVFPYHDGFQKHGGVSGALVNAMTFGKPLVISEALAGQVPQSPACQVVPCGDVHELRRAIDHAMKNTADLHQAAGDLTDYLLRQHTYEGHLDRIAERLDELNRPARAADASDRRG